MADRHGFAFDAVQMPLNVLDAHQAEIEALLARTATAAERGRWEKYRTTHECDGTHQHPEWMGEA